VSKTLAATSGRLVVLIFQIIWIAGLVYLTARINTVKCQHCGEQFAFYETGFLFVKSPPRATHCQNCKIPRYLGSSFYKGILKLSAFRKP
jgi:hypothetical protein